jgi:TatD DNase family protein
VRLVDSHGHVQSDRFDADRDAVLAAARAAGVERLLVPGWDMASSRGALDVAERFGWPDAAVGIHPHEAARADEAAWAEIAALARDPRVVAVGETGLDYDRVFSPIPDQLLNLRRHLALALELGKPAILHVRSAAGRRDAQDAILAELRAAGLGGAAAVAAFGDRPPAVIHSYSGPVDYGRAMLDLGVAVSISGLAFRKGEEATADVVALVPAERLLVETDAPFLAAPGAPRNRNAPEWVGLTAAWVAERRGVAPESLGRDLVSAYDRTFARPG